MRTINTPLAQAIYNRCISSKKDFTIGLTENPQRYVVGNRSLYEGYKPHTSQTLRTELWDIVKGGYCSVGRWEDPDTGIIYIDANTHFTELDLAIKYARSKDQIAIYDRLCDKVIFVNSSLSSNQ